MNKWQRLILAGLTFALAIIVIMLLNYAGSKAQGPFSRAISNLGSFASGFESRIVGLFRGPGRSRELQWFENYRTDRDSLLNPEVILLGSYDGNLPGSLEGVVSLEKSLGLTFPLIHFYTAWGDKPEQRFPARLVKAIWDIGSVSVINWEPWFIDFKKESHPQLPPPDDRDQGGMASIAGGEYDFYIDAWAEAAASFGKPFFLCFGHEMNDPYRYPWGPPNNQPQEYIAAWRHLIERFHLAGADNIIWVWTPSLAYQGYEYYYPGEDAVDWIATNVLNFGTVAHWSQWWSFKQLFSDKYEPFADLGKPIMISEFGTLEVGGERLAWYREALTDLPRRFPEVKSLLFFHVLDDATVTYKKIDWSFSEDSDAVEVVCEAIETWVPSDEKIISEEP